MDFMNNTPTHELDQKKAKRTRNNPTLQKTDFLPIKTRKTFHELIAILTRLLL